MKKFWNWARDETAPDARVLRLEGTIAEESWFDDDVTPAAFKGELFSETGPVTIWINSPGGDCVAAAQIYNMLMDYPGDVTVKVDGTRRLCRISHRHGGNARAHVARVYYDDPQPAYRGHGR